MRNETSSKAKPAMDNMKTANSTVKQRKNETSSSSNAESKAVDEVLDTMTEHTVEDLTGVIHDVQSTSNVMLRKLNDAMFNQQCTCERHTEERRREWAELKTRIQKLEKDGKQKEEVVRRLMEELKALHDEVMTLQNRYEPVGSEEADTDVPDKANVEEAPAKAAALALQNDINAPTEPEHENTDEEFVIELDKDSSESTTVEISSEVADLVRDENEQGCDTESAGFVRAANQTVVGDCDGAGQDKVEDKHRERASSEIMKPNFLKPVSIPVQTQAQQGDQGDIGAKRMSDGMCTLILVDTSGSMAGDAIFEAGAFVLQFLEGLEDNWMKFNLIENVALGIFGQDADIKEHLTSDYSRIRRALDSLLPEGPTRMDLGIALPKKVFAPNNDQHKRDYIAEMNGHHVLPRVIIISDGFPTLSIDVQHSATQETEMLQNICIELNQSLASKIIYKVYCVPVGKTPQTHFLEKLSTSTGGGLIQPSEPKRASRCYLHHHLVGQLMRDKLDIQNRDVVAKAVKQNKDQSDETDVEGMLAIISQGEPDLQAKKAQTSDSKQQSGKPDDAISEMLGLAPASGGEEKPGAGGEQSPASEGGGEHLKAKVIAALKGVVEEKALTRIIAALEGEDSMDLDEMIQAVGGPLRGLQILGVLSGVGITTDQMVQMLSGSGIDLGNAKQMLRGSGIDIGQMGQPPAVGTEKKSQAIEVLQEKLFVFGRPSNPMELFKTEFGEGKAKLFNQEDQTSAS